MTDETPTPRLSTGSFDVARTSAVEAARLGERLRSAAEREADFTRGLALRQLARRCSAMVEAFSAWIRREATYEQKGEDAERWEAIRAEARDLGVS